MGRAELSISSTELRGTMGDFLMTYPFLFSIARSFKGNIIPGLLASKLHYFTENWENKQKEEGEDKEGKDRALIMASSKKMVYKTKIF